MADKTRDDVQSIDPPDNSGSSSKRTQDEDDPAPIDPPENTVSSDI